MCDIITSPLERKAWNSNC